MRTKIWSTSTKTSHETSPRAERMIPGEATSHLLLFFHPGSFTRKPTKFDLRALILFIWGRKWGAESGEEQLASSTTETKHLLVIWIGNQPRCTKGAFLGRRCAYLEIRVLFCVLVRLRYGWIWVGDTKNEREVEARGGNVRNHNTGTWPLCELWLHKTELLGSSENSISN